MIRDNNFSDRFSFDLDSTVSFNVLSWLSFDWNLKVLRNPAVIEEVQILSNLMLAAKYSF